MKNIKEIGGFTTFQNEVMDCMCSKAVLAMNHNNFELLQEELNKQVGDFLGMGGVDADFYKLNFRNAYTTNGKEVVAAAIDMAVKHKLLKLDGNDLDTEYFGHQQNLSAGRALGLWFNDNFVQPTMDDDGNCNSLKIDLISDVATLVVDKNREFIDNKYEEFEKKVHLIFQEESNKIADEVYNNDMDYAQARIEANVALRVQNELFDGDKTMPTHLIKEASRGDTLLLHREYATHQLEKTLKDVPIEVLDKIIYQSPNANSISQTLENDFLKENKKIYSRRQK